jgi:16S rRNA (uracil1498-N3)-methyltransferase
MSIPRVFQNAQLELAQEIIIDELASHHLSRVLRVRVSDPVIVFNGKGGEYTGVITAITKKNITLSLNSFHDDARESGLNLTLAQGISRGEKMDFTIQKAVELGVKKIVPLFTERCNVKLTAERAQKRIEHWQGIVQSACEQSGRNFVPIVTPPQQFLAFTTNLPASAGVILSPFATQKLASLSLHTPNEIVLIIGPEGGFSVKEIAHCDKKGFAQLNLGPRILRTETAALAAITALQCQFGDMQ